MDKVNQELGGGPVTGSPTPQADTPTLGGQRLGRVSLLLLAFLVGAVLASYLVDHLTWLIPFGQDLAGWLVHPRVAGPLNLPPGLAKVGADTALAALTAWLTTDLILARSCFARNWPCRVGVAVVLTISVLGLAGMFSVVAGQVTVVFILTIQSILATVIVLVWWRFRSWRRVDQISKAIARNEKSGRGYRVLLVGGVVVAGVVVIFTLIHAVMSPVLEWDATIYHAASARLWYMGRPNPPLMFGPSIGIETSYNYPPLFPAAGLVTDVVGGGFHDLYLRIASPLLLASLFAMIFGYTGDRFGRRQATWALLLAVGSPLVVMYGAWTTDYMLVVCLIFATVLVADAAAQRGSYGAWAAPGLVGGLAMLTNFIGWFALAVGLLAVLTQTRRARWVGSALIFGTCAVVTASPWLLRNWILLKDPLYPLLGGLFHTPGLTGAIFRASEAELESNALRTWAGSPFPLRLAELGTALFNGNTLAIGVLPAIVFGVWRARHREWRSVWLMLICLAMICVLLAPGWYWLRYLLPLVAVASVLGGCVLVALSDVAHSLVGARVRGLVGRGARAVVPAMLVAVAVVSAAVGLGLSISGPEQFNVWTENLDPAAVNFMTPVDELGSNHDLLWTTFSGDYLAWEWINSHVLKGQRVATLEDRTYYITRPQTFFYLDGGQATPLLRLNTPRSARRFLLANNVRWILISEWDRAPSTRDPALGLLPLSRFLGGRSFPLRAAFTVSGLHWLTEIYAVGGAPSRVDPAVFPGFTSPAPNNGTYTIEPGIPDSRIYIPTADETLGARLSFAFRQPHGSFQLKYQEPGSSKWRTLLQESTPSRTPGWKSVDINLPKVGRTQLQMTFDVSGSALQVATVRSP
jgi:hypothetical protein